MDYDYKQSSELILKLTWRYKHYQQFTAPSTNISLSTCNTEFYIRVCHLLKTYYAYYRFCVALNSGLSFLKSVRTFSSAFSIFTLELRFLFTLVFLQHTSIKHIIYSEKEYQYNKRGTMLNMNLLSSSGAQNSLLAIPHFLQNSVATTE